MATLHIDSKRIIENIKKISHYLKSNGKEWSLVTKVLGGDKRVLLKLLEDESIKSVHSIGDSRVSNLKAIKEINPNIVTMYIKPPAPNLAKSIVKYADISFNTTLHTIRALDKEAAKQGKKHRVIIMIELGELREGILRDNVLDFYEKIFRLENIRVDGLGTNLGCMYGIEPTYDKLIQLSLYRMLIQEKFDKKLALVSAGSSITLPLIKKHKVPGGVNHFRIGETAFLGIALQDQKRFRNLSTSVFDFCAEIIEVEKKEIVPDGVVSDAGIGKIAEIETSDKYKKSHKAIVDFGQIDVDVNNITPKDKEVKFFGTTSDMTVYDLGDNKKSYKVGKQIHFKPNYMAVARLMTTKYIAKIVK